MIFITTLSKYVKTHESSEKEYYLVGIFRQIEIPRRRPGNFNRPSPDEIEVMRKADLLRECEEQDVLIKALVSNAAERVKRGRKKGGSLT